MGSRAGYQLVLTIPQIEKQKQEHPYLYETLNRMVEAINSIARQTGADPVGVFPTTPNITAVNVTAANGLYNVQLVDNAFVNSKALSGRAISYFVEFATDQGFVHIVHHEAMGATRNRNIFLGNQTLFIRAYSQLQGSAPSAPVYFGAPTAVVGGGVAAPTQQAYQGSGTSRIGGQGFGAPVRSPGRPSGF